MRTEMSHPEFTLLSGPSWADPWPMYAALRDSEPVHHVGADSPHDYWVMSRHADIWSAARDHQTFSSAQGLTVNYNELELIGLADNPPMVMQDPPAHTEFRKLVARGFTPRQVESVEPKVREFVIERIERMRAQGGGDIIAELFKPLPSGDDFLQPPVHRAACREGFHRIGDFLVVRGFLAITGEIDVAVRVQQLQPREMTFRPELLWRGG